LQFALYLLNRLTPDLDFFVCVWVLTLFRLGWKIEVRGQGQLLGLGSSTTDYDSSEL